MGTDDKIIEILADIHALLVKTGEKQWSLVIDKLIADRSAEPTNQDVINNILSIYKGGMGSFSDLVLHKDGKMLIEENDQLAQMKKNLYQICKSSKED